jgi:hypothetical protein
MKRGIQIFVSLLAVVLLVRPFDCFVGAKPSQQAMDCCLKGKCIPSAQSDECCKNAAPDGGQGVFSNAPAHSGPLVAPGVTSASLAIPDALTSASIEPFRHPPPSRGLSAGNLPLLI